MLSESRKNHSNADCFVCVLLSHGDDGVIAGINGKFVKLQDLIGVLKGDSCPSLSGKPKLFFIQVKVIHHSVITIITIITIIIIIIIVIIVCESFHASKSPIFNRHSLLAPQP